ncbi:MAG: GNAT family N-acetyltransferase [Geodermatophilaceae bacterium]|nr:GNAT family N-acetyltransferase [Geodermatophilaceae bacterium]
MSGEAGRPAVELDDAELEAQGTQAHATRNWVFLHGTAEQFARHTSRMLELEQEFLRRHPHRTWQGSGGAGSGRRDEIAALREAVRAIAAQLQALAAEPPSATPAPTGAEDPVLLLLAAVAAAPDGRMHKLELHQAARESGVDRTALAALYTAAEPLLSTEQQDRVLTDAGRVRLRAAGMRSRAASAPTAPGSWTWEQQTRPTWDPDKQRIVGGAPAGIFAVDHASGAVLPGDWWAVRDGDGPVLGFGWMDVGWGEAEILLAVEPDAQESGVGSFVLEQLEREAAARGLNYVYNTVATSHPRREEMIDWLGARGYYGLAEDPALRKRVGTRTPVPAPRPPPTGAPSADLGPGREDSGGYVAVEDHQY